MSEVVDPPWASEALARINHALGRAYRLGEHISPPNPLRPHSGVWVVRDGDLRMCLKRVGGDSDLTGQREAAATCDRLHRAGSPVPRYHFVEAVADDGYALMDFMPGHPVLVGGITARQAEHLLELIELQAGAAVLPMSPPDTVAANIVEWTVSAQQTPRSAEAARLIDHVQAMAKELRDVATPSNDIVHTDMNPSNFIVDREGGARVVGIVDWENTITGDRAADVMGIFHYLWDYHRASDPEACEVLWRGLAAITTADVFRLRVVGLAWWSFVSGNLDGASALLDRISG